MIVPMSKKALFLSACPIYLFFFMGDAVLTSYYSLFFIARGMDATQQSILLALIPFSIFLGCITLSALAKTRKSTLWLFRICAIIEAALALCFAFCTNFVSLLIVTFFIAFFNGAPFSLIEGWLVPMVKAKGGNYASIRVFGTLGYIVSLAGGYFFLRYFPLQNAYFLSMGFYLTALGLSFLLRDDLDLSAIVEKEAPSQPNKKLLIAPVIIYWLTSFFFYGVYNASSYLLPVYLTHLGYLDADYSMARAAGVAAEFVMLLLMPLITKHFKNKKTPLFIAIGFVVVGTASVMFGNNPWVIAYANMILTHIGKAFLFAHEALLLVEIVGKDRISKVLTINWGAINLSSALLNLSSSFFYELWGFQTFFGILTGLEVVGLVLLIALPMPKSESPKAA